MTYSFVLARQILRSIGRKRFPVKIFKITFPLIVLWLKLPPKSLEREQFEWTWSSAAQEHTHIQTHTDTRDIARCSQREFVSFIFIFIHLATFSKTPTSLFHRANWMFNVTWSFLFSCKTPTHSRNDTLKVWMLCFSIRSSNRGSLFGRNLTVTNPSWTFESRTERLGEKDETLQGAKRIVATVIATLNRKLRALPRTRRIHRDD